MAHKLYRYQVPIAVMVIRLVTCLAVLSLRLDLREELGTLYLKSIMRLSLVEMLLDLALRLTRSEPEPQAIGDVRSLLPLSI
jgi:hypothetical protein